MTVDVRNEIEINRARGEVATYAADPDNATSWYENIKAVEWKSPQPLSLGSRVAFVAEFLGRDLSYTYQVQELCEGERLVMSTSEGPFAMDHLSLGRHRQRRHEDDASQSRRAAGVLQARCSDHRCRHGSREPERPKPPEIPA